VSLDGCLNARVLPTLQHRDEKFRVPVRSRCPPERAGWEATATNCDSFFKAMNVPMTGPDGKKRSAGPSGFFKPTVKSQSIQVILVFGVLWKGTGGSNSEGSGT